MIEQEYIRTFYKWKCDGDTVILKSINLEIAKILKCKNGSYRIVQVGGNPIKMPYSCLNAAMQAIVNRLQSETIY